MQRWTPDELAAMAAADAEIEEDFVLTDEEIAASRNLDRLSKYEEKDQNDQRVAAQKKAWYEANRERVAAQKKAYREANREHLREYHREYRKKRKEFERAKATL